MISINNQMNGVLETTIRDNYNSNNQFFDDDCVEADNDLSNPRPDDQQQDQAFKKQVKKVSGIMARLSRSVN